MSTILFSPCYLDGLDKVGGQRIDRNRKYIDYYLPLKDKLGFDKIVMADNASNNFNIHKLGAHIFSAETMEPTHTGLGLVDVYRFDQHLKTGKDWDYPYCWRALHFLIKYIDTYKPKKIIMIDTDGFVLSQKMADYVKNCNSGWEAFWCARHDMPESSFQIINEDAFPILREFFKDGYMQHNGKLMEKTLPYTKVNKDFVTDRFGEVRAPQTPDMDYYTQCPNDIKLVFEKKMVLKISVAMIVKNESVLLSRCLNSVKDADEIVVVDTGSIDNTVDVAKLYTDKIFNFKWCDDFAKARNYAIEQVTGDWVISIDADEVLEPGGIQKIRDAIAKHPVGTLQVKLVAEGGVDYLHNVRVFDKNQRFHGAIHETVPAHSNNLRTDIKITYGSSPAHDLDPDRNLRILKSESETKPTARSFYYLAREYWYKKDYANAIVYWEKCNELSQWMPERADTYLYLARCYWLTGQGDKARDRCMNAILINPDLKEAVEFMGDIVWPKYTPRWKKFSESCTNQDVLFIRSPAKIESQTMETIRLHRWGGLGDVCMMLAAAKAIKNNRKCKIVVSTAPHYRELALACPWVDELASESNLGGKTYDWSSSKYGTAPKHQVDAYLDDLGIVALDEDKTLDLKGKAWDGFKDVPRNKPIIAIHAGITYLSKTWSKDYWIKLIGYLKDYNILLIGAKGCADNKSAHTFPPLSGVYDLTDKLSLLQTVWILQRCKMLITTDSGPVQLAGAARCPVVAMYSVVGGPTKMPFGIKSKMVEPMCPHYPCYQGMKDEKTWQANIVGKTSLDQIFAEWCLNKDKYSCMTQMTPEIVYSKILGLKQKAPPQT